jgi:hypothetical protein
MEHRQLPRPLPSEGKGHKFESCRARQSNQWLAPIIAGKRKAQTHHRLTNGTGVLACDRRRFPHAVALNSLPCLAERSRIRRSKNQDVSIVITSAPAIGQERGATGRTSKIAFLILADVRTSRSKSWERNQLYLLLRAAAWAPVIVLDLRGRVPRGAPTVRPQPLADLAPRSRSQVTNVSRRVSRLPAASSGVFLV